MGLSGVVILLAGVLPILSQSARKDGAPAVVGCVGEQRVPHRAFSPVRNDKTSTVTRLE